MEEEKKKERNLINNMKGILIILVVIGHLTEKSVNPNILFSAKFIYSFHMTAFILVSGYLAKNPKTNIKNLINVFLLYLSFNTVMQLVFNNKFTLAPFWTLWYLEALVVYRIFLIPINKIKESGKLKEKIFNIGIIGFIIITIFISIFGIIFLKTYMNTDVKLIKIAMYLPIFFIGYIIPRDLLIKMKDFISRTIKRKCFSYYFYNYSFYS